MTARHLPNKITFNKQSKMSERTDSEKIDEKTIKLDVVE